MGERKAAKVEKIEQRIDENFKGNFTQFPSQLKNFFTDNFIYRGMVLLQGVTSRMEAKLLECTNSGVLKVANVGSGIEQMLHADITAVAAESPVGLDAPLVSNKVRFVGVDFDFYFRPSPDGVTYQDQIYVIAGNDTQIDLVVKKYKVQRVGSNDATGRVEFYK